MNIKDKKQIQKAYTDYAEEYSKKFNALGTRKEIEFVLKESPNPLSVLELGCGNGRDARIILKYTNKYIGTDFSSGLIKIAKQNNKAGKFINGDFGDTKLYEHVDLSTVFAFDSLIHCSSEEIKTILKNITKLLHNGGIICASFKYGRYSKITRTDELGTRHWFLYSPSFLKKILPNNLKIIKVTHYKNVLRTPRFTIIFQKLSKNL